MQEQNSDSVENPEQDSILGERTSSDENRSVYQAQPVPHRSQPAPPSGTSGDNQYYIQQLIDTLQKRNQFMTIMLVLLIVVSVAASFGAFKIYIDYQSAIQNVNSLQSDESQQKQAISNLNETLNQLQTKHDELTQTNDVAGQQLNASSSKLVTTEQMVEALKTNLELVKAQRQQLEQENKIIRSALDTTSAGKEKTLSLIDEKETEMEQLRDQLVFDQQQNKALKTEVTNRKNAFNALSKRYQAIKGDIFSLEQTLDQSNKQVVSKSKEIKGLQAQAVTKAAELDKAKKEIAALKSRPLSTAQPQTLSKPVQSSPTESKSTKSAKPLTSSSKNTLDVPDEIIIDLN